MKAGRRGGVVVVRMLAAGLCVGAGFAAAGCGAEPVSVAQRTSDELPVGVSAFGDNTAPSAVWIGPGETFAVVLWGSSSCAPTATALEAETPDRISIRFAPSSSELCTADMAPTVYEFALPDGVATGQHLDITLADESSTWTTITLDSRLS